MEIEDDILVALGTRAFATRLRRLLETLNRDVALYYKEAGVLFEPRWFGLITLVRRSGETEIGVAATHLGQSHVAVVQVANALEKRGLMRRITSRQDRRRSALKLTAKGEGLCVLLEPLWEAVAQATADLLEEAAPHFLQNIDAIDRALAKQSLLDRIHDVNLTRSSP